MNHEQVMRQALDAMLNFPDDISDEMFESITALKAALAELVQDPEPREYHGWVLREVLFDNGEPIGHREPVQDQDIEDAIEAAYWHFDCRRSGLNEWASAPQSERDAFKAEARKLIIGAVAKEREQCAQFVESEYVHDFKKTWREGFAQAIRLKKHFGVE